LQSRRRDATGRGRRLHRHVGEPARLR
jgi:hypothetical protein